MILTLYLIFTTPTIDTQPSHQCITDTECEALCLTDLECNKLDERWYLNQEK